MSTNTYPRCTKVLRAAGVAYPRTCAECGLGPCKAGLGQGDAQAKSEACIGGNPTCPCQDGDACHYRDAADGTKAWPIPEPSQAEPTDADGPIDLCPPPADGLEFGADGVLRPIAKPAAPKREPSDETLEAMWRALSGTDLMIEQSRMDGMRRVWRAAHGQDPR